MKVLIDKFGDGIQVGIPVFWDMGQESQETVGARAAEIEKSLNDFEAIFQSESRRMSIFRTEQKGIYNTEDLIDHADLHLPGSLRHLLPKQAELDLISSGKCLAFNLPTSCAFHMWRALESTFGIYYKSLSGKTFEEAGVGRNWGTYIKAMKDSGADVRITGNLDHIRAEYRNPVMHPSENVTEEEAFGLFGMGISAISQVLKSL